MKHFHYSILNRDKFIFKNVLYKFKLPFYCKYENELIIFFLYNIIEHRQKLSKFDNIL